MSEKRFARWNDHSCKVKDNQEDTLLNWEDVVKKLNEQQDTIGEQKIAIDELITDYKKLEDENEQLKQFKEKVFTLIDKKIAKNEEAIEWGKETGADIGAMGFHNHMLKILKKELKE